MQAILWHAWSNITVILLNHAIVVCDISEVVSS